MSAERGTPLPEMDAVRAQLRMAAAREHEPAGRDPIRSRWRRRGIAAVGVAGLASAAVAGAAQLVTTGTPVNSRPDQSSADSRYQPGARAPTLVLTAPDAEAGRTWGVSAFDLPGGRRCALVGQVVGRRLGLVRGGRFLPYSARPIATCGSAGSRVGYVVDRRNFATSPPRFVVYGRVTRGSATAVRIDVPGSGRRTARLGPAGSFLFVFAGRLTSQRYTVEPLPRR